MAVPEQALWIRNYLEKRGISKFIVVLSNWHKDHIAGNEIYKDSDIIAQSATFETMLKNKAAIEAGELPAPPAINPLIMPNITFESRLDIYVGDIKVELHHFNIHSPDGNRFTCLQTRSCFPATPWNTP